MTQETEHRVPFNKAMRLATAFGIVWGGAMFVTGIVASYTDWYAHEIVRVFGSIYYGYVATWAGAFAGLIWGFLDAFVGTLVIVGVYNVLMPHHREAAAGHPALQ